MKAKKEIVTLKYGITIEYTPFCFVEEAEPIKSCWIIADPLSKTRGILNQKMMKYLIT
jgi:hypothetical protein